MKFVDYNPSLNFTISIASGLEIITQDSNSLVHLSTAIAFHSCTKGIQFYFPRLELMLIKLHWNQSTPSKRIWHYINMVHSHFALNYKMRDKICAMASWQSQVHLESSNCYYKVMRRWNLPWLTPLCYKCIWMISKMPLNIIYMYMLMQGALLYFKHWSILHFEHVVYEFTPVKL